jgi:hypothetical protein
MKNEHKKYFLVIAFTVAYWFIMIVPMLRLEFLVLIDEYRYHTLRPLMCTYPFLLGGLLYYLWGRKTKSHLKSFLKSLAISFIWLISAFALCIGAMSFYYIVVEKIYYFHWYNLFNFFVTSPLWFAGVCFMFYFFAILLVGWLIYIINNKINSQCDTLSLSK